MIRAVFLDFDGTIFSHHSVSIPASTILAINKLRENGILVFLCTGRSYPEFEDFDLRPLNLNGKIVANGQVILNEKDEIIFERPFEGELKEKITALFEEASFPMYLVAKEEFYINKINDLVISIQDSVSSSLPKVKHYSGETIYMASAFFGKKEDIDRIFALSDIAEIAWWHPGAVDIMPKGVSKAEGIDEVCHQYHIDPSETLAIGDGPNDAEMLKHCAIGIAMGNGANEAKQAADYVTKDIDEDGLYLALKHYNLI